MGQFTKAIGYLCSSMEYREYTIYLLLLYAACIVCSCISCPVSQLTEMVQKNVLVSFF